MLRTEQWIRPYEGLSYEIQEALSEGRQVDDLIELEKEISAMSQLDETKGQRATALYAEVQRRPYRDDYRFNEPVTYEEIEKLSNFDTIDLPAFNLSESEIRDKIEGAWLARCAGCLLGKPLEGWRRERILGFLKDIGNLPVHRYVSSDVSPDIREKHYVSDEMSHLDQPVSWINNVTCMPEDDDTNYTVLGLTILEKFGREFNSEDVAEQWVKKLPFLHLCTAERVAYKNIALFILPPKSAVYCNPYREYLGAQIRSDIYGYINPGDPVSAAEMAYRDASVSAVKNGVYGAMFLAAVIAAAAVTSDPIKLIKTGLCCIPSTCRLYEQIQRLIGYSEGKTYNAVLDWINECYDETNNFDWCHAIPNIMIICTAILFSGWDVSKAFSICIEASFDTDCNAANVGSVLGAVLGKSKLPEKWVAPLNDSIITGIHGMNKVSISDMADRTTRIALSAKG